MKPSARLPARRGHAARVNPRARAAKVVVEVILHTRYLDTALEESLAALPPAQRHAAALIQELAYGVLRWFHQLEAAAARLLVKPLKAKDQDIQALLLLGLYQLRHMRVAQHAAVKETVDAASALKKPWAKNLLNACLRSYLRETEQHTTTVDTEPSIKFSHPVWLLDRVRHDWPDDWERILTANNQRPPMVLRVNRRRQTRERYLARLAQAGIAALPLPLTEAAVVLETPVSVGDLPGFGQGEVSVQDAAAQFAAVLLDAQAGERVLDACAAPGGKTGQLLEHTPGLNELVALDREPARVALIEQNLVRLNLPAKTVVGNAAHPADWWDGRLFDRLLIDAPCSATGVIRRHPDIKVRRRPEDLPKLIATQAQILDGLWPLLKPGGKLLYVTCSILPEENENQMERFLARHADAEERVLALSAGRARSRGRQILPGEAGMDGFYYACIGKN